LQRAGDLATIGTCINAVFLRHEEHLRRSLSVEIEAEDANALMLEMLIARQGSRRRDIAVAIIAFAFRLCHEYHWSLKMSRAQTSRLKLFPVPGYQ
jgi:hypothetical protein